MTQSLFLARPSIVAVRSHCLDVCSNGVINACAHSAELDVVLLQCLRL